MHGRSMHSRRQLVIKTRIRFIKIQRQGNILAQSMPGGYSYILIDDAFVQELNLMFAGVYIDIDSGRIYVQK